MSKNVKWYAVVSAIYLIIMPAILFAAVDKEYSYWWCLLVCLCSVLVYAPFMIWFEYKGLKLGEDDKLNLNSFHVGHEYSGQKTKPILRIIRNEDLGKLHKLKEEAEIARLELIRIEAEKERRGEL